MNRHVGPTISLRSPQSPDKGPFNPSTQFMKLNASPHRPEHLIILVISYSSLINVWSCIEPVGEDRPPLQRRRQCSHGKSSPPPDQNPAQPPVTLGCMSHCHQRSLGEPCFSLTAWSELSPHGLLKRAAQSPGTCHVRAIVLPYRVIVRCESDSLTRDLRKRSPFCFERLVRWRFYSIPSNTDVCHQIMLCCRRLLHRVYRTLQSVTLP